MNRRTEYQKLRHTCGITKWGKYGMFKPDPNCAKCQLRVELEKESEEQGIGYGHSRRLPNLSQRDGDFS